MTTVEKSKIVALTKLTQLNLSIERVDLNLIKIEVLPNRLLAKLAMSANYEKQNVKKLNHRMIQACRLTLQLERPSQLIFALSGPKVLINNLDQRTADLSQRSRSEILINFVNFALSELENFILESKVSDGYH